MKKYKGVLITIYEIVTIALGLLTFKGDYFIGRNINGYPFVILLALYVGVVTYKIASHVQDTISEVKNGTWGK